LIGRPGRFDAIAWVRGHEAAIMLYRRPAPYFFGPSRAGVSDLGIPGLRNGRVGSS
jgi:hypothetical protein